MTPAVRDGTVRSHRLPGPGVLLGLILLALGAAGPVAAQERGHAVPPGLLQKARAEGTVRVIVELGGARATVEGHLSGAVARAAQRGRIAAERGALLARLKGLRHRVLREFRTIPYVGLEVDHAALSLLDALPGLATRVHEDILLEPLLAESGPLITAPDAWAAGWDGTGHVIAIVDTGVDKDHPFLAGKVVEEACYSAEGDCPNAATSHLGADAAVPCTFAPLACRHGTHVAGIAAGAGVSFSGVAPGASIMAVRVFSHFTGGLCAGQFEDPCALSWTSDQVAGLERVYELRDTHAFAAVNMSLGSGGFPTYCDGEFPALDAVIGNLRSVGIATVIAAGNNGFLDRISFPACISSAISVGATTDGSGGPSADLVASFSNSAFFLSLLAPGSVITSSVPGGGFGDAQGTSMAAPHVAGAWAVIKQARPLASVSTVLGGLQNNGKPITDVNGVTTSRIAFSLLQFSVSAWAVNESAGVATITVTRSATFGAISVDYATSAGSALPGRDYTETSGTLVFNPGVASQTFTVPILNNATVDGARTVNLTLSNPGGGALLGAQDTATLTISDNDVGGSVQFSAAQYSVIEGAGTATITVTRTGGSAEVSVHYATADGTGHAGTDYGLASGTLDFGAGVMSRTFTVPILPNGIVDGSRTVGLALDTPGGGAVLGGQKTATLTIVDDEISLQFSATQYSVNEGGGSAAITVTRTGPFAPPVGVTYTVLPGTATPGADYGAPFIGTLAFAANQTSRTFTVPIVNDTLAEGPETVLLKLSNPTGALLGPRSTAVLTITDNDGGGAFGFSTGSYSASEASATTSVTVTRSNGSASNGTVRLRSVDVGGGTAVPGDDYTPIDQILTFAAGQTSRTVPITLNAGLNTRVDGARTIRLVLEEPAPSGLASLGSPAVTLVTLTDNDVAGTLQFSPASVTVVESAGPVQLTVTRTGGAASEVGVTWDVTGGTAAHGTDFAGPVTGTLTFGPGVPSQPLSIPLLNSGPAHGPRTIVVTLKDPTGGAKLGTKTATITLLDDVVGFQFNQAGYSASEGSGSVTITVLRTGPTGAAVTVAYETGAGGTATPGTHYAPVAGPLSFGVGQTSRTFAVPLQNNTLTEPGLTIQLHLKDPSAGEVPVPDAFLTINDNDPAGTFRFSAGTYTVTEGAANPTFNLTVTRTGGSGGGVTVPWSITGGTATRADALGPGVDVITPVSGHLTFGPGVMSQVIPITIVDDLDPESNETLVFTLGTPTPGGAIGSPGIATLAIVDNDRTGTFQFTVAAAQTVEAAGPVSVAVTRTGNTSAAASVDWIITGGTASRGDAAAPGVDYVSPASGPLPFAAGETTKTIPLTVVGDPDLEGDETIVVELQNPSAGWALGLAATTLALVEGTVQFQTATPTVNESSGSATITVTRTGLTTQAATVQYTVGPGGSATPANPATACQAGADYRPVTGTVVFSPGQTSKTFSVPLCADTGVEGDETVELSLALVSGPVILGTPATATLTIVDNDFAGAVRFSSAAYGASEAQASVTLTVVRTSTGGGASVDWTIVGGTAVFGTDYSGPTAGTLVFGAGQTSQPLVIPLVNDALTDGPQTLVVGLSNPLPAGLATLGTPVQTTVTLGDSEPVLRLSAATYAATEGAAAVTVTVLRAGATGVPASVSLVPVATSGATGGACGVGDADFASAPIPVAFAANQTSKTVLVPLCSDTRAEDAESFTVELQDPVGASVGSPPAAVVTIADNDLGGSFKWSAAQVSGVEGSSVVLTVTRTGGVASDVTVDVETQDGDEDGSTANAVAGADYTALPPTTLTFNAGVTSQTVAIPLLTPVGDQGPRVFRVRLQDPQAGASLGSPATALVWTLD